jgi:hypothetical protein
MTNEMYFSIWMYNLTLHIPVSLCSAFCFVLWFHREMCNKECCLFGCDTVLVGRYLPTYVRNILLQRHYSNLRMWALDSSKSLLFCIRLHSAISHKTLFLIPTASRILHVYIVSCKFLIIRYCNSVVYC